MSWSHRLTDSIRRISLISDTSEELPVSVNDTMAFALKVPSEGPSGDEQEVGVIVLGINVVDGLEMFSENFEIETAIVVADRVITVYDYYEEEKPEGLLDLIASDQSESRSTGYT